jgi:hypothetical protein
MPLDPSNNAKLDHSSGTRWPICKQVCPSWIVWPSILNPVINFFTHLWPVKWNALGYTFALRIPFHLLQCWCNTCTNQSQMRWSTSYHHVTVLIHRSWLHLLFTVASVHERQVITQLALHTCNRSIEQSLVLIFSTLVTWLNVMSHMQWALSLHVWALQQIQAIFTVVAWVAHTSIPMD